MLGVRVILRRKVKLMDVFDTIAVANFIIKVRITVSFFNDNIGYTGFFRFSTNEKIVWKRLFFLELISMLL